MKFEILELLLDFLLFWNLLVMVEMEVFWLVIEGVGVWVIGVGLGFFLGEVIGVVVGVGVGVGVGIVIGGL